MRELLTSSVAAVSALLVLAAPAAAAPVEEHRYGGCESVADGLTYCSTLVVRVQSTSTPAGVDVWRIETRYAESLDEAGTVLRSFSQTSRTSAVSRDGRTLVVTQRSLGAVDATDRTCTYRLGFVQVRGELVVDDYTEQCSS